MKILETKHLTKRFAGVHAIENLSLAIDKSSITSIVGPNGSGKTTLMNLLSGFIPFDEGVVVLNETKSLDGIKPHTILSHGITRTFQDVRLFNQMTVLDNILVVLTARGVFSSLFKKHTNQDMQKAEAVLRQVGLWEKRSALAITLSYGQRKLLEIARAISTGAEIFLFDEPFAGLFPEMVKTISGIIQELKQQGKTIILIEHNMDLIRQLSDCVLVMDSGKLLAAGRPAEVLEKKEVIAAYLGE